MLCYCDYIAPPCGRWAA